MPAVYTVWICPECKSTDVRELRWINPNDKNNGEADSHTEYRCESCGKNLSCLDDIELVEGTHELAIDKVRYLTGHD